MQQVYKIIFLWLRHVDVVLWDLTDFWTNNYICTEFQILESIINKSGYLNILFSLCNIYLYFFNEYESWYCFICWYFYEFFISYKNRVPCLLMSSSVSILVKNLQILKQVLWVVQLCYFFYFLNWWTFLYIYVSRFGV